jgi:hypothetical protein
MKSRTLIILGIVLVLLIGILIVAVTFSKKAPTSPASTTPVGFPESGTVSNSGTSATSTSTSKMLINLRNGTKAPANNFITNGTTIEDPANKGTYYLAGSSIECTTGSTCPIAGTEKDFTIVYYPNTQSFNIGLAAEPLGSVRKEAEQYLMKALGLTQDQMCNLTYYIGTTTYVNPQYGGENLGFSFCPGAVALPE